MKKTFREYYTPTKAEFSSLWGEALVAFDANVLLHVLRFKKSSAEEVLSTIEALGARAWVPHQAAQEFLSNRHGVFSSLEQPYTKLDTYFSAQSEAIEKEIGAIKQQFRDHPSLDFDTLAKNSSELFKELGKKLKAQQKAHPSAEDAETTVEKLTHLFDGRAGKEPLTPELEAWKKEAKIRYAAQVPPGYLDAKKDDGGYGDYFMWQQIIAHAAEKKSSIILVTDDVKDDWWLRVSGRTIGPRPELRKEFFDLTGQQFYTYTLAEYLRRSKAAGGKISDDAVREAEAEIARAREMQMRVRHLNNLHQHEEYTRDKLRDLEARQQHLADRMRRIQSIPVEATDEIEGTDPQRIAAERLRAERHHILLAREETERELQSIQSARERTSNEHFRPVGIGRFKTE